MKRRLLIMVLALILAGIGTGGVVSYVKKANARALARLQPVSVLVAQRAIEPGTTAGAALRGGLLVSEELPASTVPANALSSVPGALQALTFSAALPAGQLLLRPMLVQETQLTSGLAIPSGMMAVTINFCLSEAVAGAVHPGSEVAVFDTTGSGTSQLSGQPGCAGAHQDAVGGAKTRAVLTRVLVLSVGASTSSTASGPATAAVTGGSASSASSSGTLVTLAVGQAQAEQLIQLTEAGLPYLALLSDTSRTTADAGNMLYARPNTGVSPAPSPVLTFPVVTPSPVPTQAAPSSSPSPSPSPTPSKKKKKHKKGK